MKKLLIALVISTLSCTLFASSSSGQEVLDKLSALDPATASAEEVQAIHTELTVSGISHAQAKVGGETLAHRLVRAGNAVALRVLRLAGVDFSVKNDQQVTVKELAESLRGPDVAGVLAEFDAENPRPAFDGNRFFGLVQDCLIPPPGSSDILAQLESYINAHPGAFVSIDAYCPVALDGESLGHSLDSYNPELYPNRDAILRLLEPARAIKEYDRDMSNDEEVAQLIRRYLAGHDDIDLSELKVVFEAWPIWVDAYPADERHLITLGKAVDDSRDAGLIELCKDRRRTTSSWVTKKTDSDCSGFFNLMCQCLMKDSEILNSQLDYYVRFIDEDKSCIASFPTGVKRADGTPKKVSDFVAGLNAELFPRMAEVQARIFVEGDGMLSSKDSLINLVKDCMVEPTLYPMVEYAVGNYKGPAIDIDTLVVPAGPHAGKSVRAVLATSKHVYLKSLRALFPSKEDTQKDSGKQKRSHAKSSKKRSHKKISHEDRSSRNSTAPSWSMGKKLAIAGVFGAGIVLYAMHARNKVLLKDSQAKAL